MDLDDELLSKAIHATFTKRKVVMPNEMPVAFTPEFLENGIKETQWKAFLNRSKLSKCTMSLAEVVADLGERLWPIIQRAGTY